MKIVIIGAGAVGFDLAETVSRREHDVILIEKDEVLLGKAQEHLDCRVVAGNGVSPTVLRKIGMRDCDLFVSVTNLDEINIIACQTAHALGAKIKVARVRDEEYYQDHRILLEGLDMAINPDHEAAHSVREILFQTGATEIHEFADGKVRIIGTKVEASSMVDGKSLAELHQTLGQKIALVITIVRDGETLIPNGNTIIQADDQVFLAGARRTVDRSLMYFRAEIRKLSNVMIVGANAMGRELARDLIAAGIRVKMIDRNEEKCRQAAQLLRNVLVLHGEGADTDLLESEGVSEMDGFVSVSGDEETNIMACLLARYHGAKRTVCLVNRPDYVPLLPLLGIDAAVSPRLSTSTWIANFVNRGAIINAESLGYSGAEIMQLRVEENCQGLGKPLRKLNFPEGAVIGAVLKGGRVMTPRGDTEFNVGDEVVAFALPDGVAAIESFFSGGSK